MPGPLAPFLTSEDGDTHPSLYGKGVQVPGNRPLSVGPPDICCPHSARGHPSQRQRWWRQQIRARYHLGGEHIGQVCFPSSFVVHTVGSVSPGHAAQESRADLHSKHGQEAALGQENRAGLQDSCAAAVPSPVWPWRPVLHLSVGSACTTRRLLSPLGISQEP